MKQPLAANKKMNAGGRWGVRVFDQSRMEKFFLVWKGE